MNTLSILVAQTTGPVLMIVGLLIVAGLIGYLTAWFYAKSVYTPVIKKLEEEKAGLNNEITGLKSDITALNGKVKTLNVKIEELEIEIADKEKEVSEKVNMIIDREDELRELRKNIKVE
ncbi:MAG: hypothetical protein WCE64_11285 [Bacteroidales bacterium]